MINIDIIKERLMRFLNEYEIEIQIVDHCNLNCQGCNHLSCIAKPWFMPLDEFKKTFNLILTNLPKVKRIMILGGEPLLHPNFIEIIQYIKDNNLNNKQIDILTNGIILDKDLDTYLNLVKNTSIFYSVTQYPIIEYKNIIYKHPKIHKLSSRLFFEAPALYSYKQDISNYLNCSLYKLPCLFVKNYKIYICPLAGNINILQDLNIDIQLKKDIDYLDLYEVNEEKILNFIKNKNKTLCYYCNSQSEFYQYWAQGKTNINQLLGKFHRNNGYFINYDLYDKLYNGTNILNLMKNKRDEEYTYQESLDYNYMITGWKFHELQKLNKKLDIIIPYYNIDDKLINQLINTLLNQTAINLCQIYLISDCSKQEQKVISKFKNKFNNITFLRTSQNSGPGVARQLGIDSSFSKYFTFLDCDDEYNYPEALEDMIKQAYSTLDDCILSKVNLCQNGTINYFDLEELKKSHTGVMSNHATLYKREFILKNDIKFDKKLRAYEDGYYMKVVRFYEPTVSILDKFTYKYNRSEYELSIGNTTSSLEKLENYCNSRYLFLIRYYLKDKTNTQIIESIEELRKNIKTWEPLSKGEAEKILQIYYKKFVDYFKGEKKNDN